LSDKGPDKPNVLLLLKLLFNRRMIGLLMKSKTRNMMKALRSGGLFIYGLDRYPEKTAIVYGERRLTYREFLKRINRFNNGLLSLGLKKGDVIAVLAGNSNELLEAALGPSLIGIRTVPVNWHLKSSEIEYIINNSDSKVLVIEDQYLEKISSIKSNLKNIKEYIVAGDKVPDGMVSYERLLGDSSDADPRVPGGGGGLMLYTSGTTGRPKGTQSRALKDPSALSADDLADIVLMMSNMFYALDFDKTTNITLAAAPLYHGSPLAFCGAAFFFGGTVVIMKKFDPEEALKLIEKERVSTAFMPPILLRRIMDVPGKEDYDVSSMKALVSAAAPCPAELKANIVDFFGPCFYEFYGSTDAAMNALLKPEHYQKSPEKIKSVGIALDGNKIKIVDEHGKELPPNVPGELVLSNVVVKHLEYHKDPEKTRESYVNIDGEIYFREGEVGYVDDEGFLYIVDRKKDMIISGGVNIYPAEIEEVLLLHPSVLDAAVIGVPDEKWGESIKAIIVLREGMSATEEEMIEYCNEQLAGYKRPKSVDFTKELPRLPSGKLMKRELRERYRVGC